MLRFAFIFEMTLSILSLIWGTILVLPGNLFATPSRFDLLNDYAPDWVFGILLLTGSIFLIGFSYDPLRLIRKLAHQILSIVWLGIFILSTYRSVQNGIQPVGLLVTSLVLIVPIFHTIFYLYWSSIIFILEKK